MTMEAVYFIVSAETEDREAAYKLRDDIEIDPVIQRQIQIGLGKIG